MTNIQDSSNSKDILTYNKDGTVTLGSGMVSNGFYDIMTNKIIDSGSLIKSVNGMIQGKVTFQQNIPEKRNYLLVIMIDYKQHDFMVKHKKYSTYPFTLKGEDKISINVKITNIDADEHEFIYFIMSEPDIKKLSIDDGDEWNKLMITGYMYSWRLLISNSVKSIKTIEYDSSYSLIDFKINYGVQLTKSYKQAAAMPSCKSGEVVNLILSNTNNYDTEYALIALLKWKQEVINGRSTLYVKIPAKSSIYYKIKIPSVEENTPYQIIAIPKPFSADLNEVAPPACTLRTMIEP